MLEAVIVTALVVFCLACVMALCMIAPDDTPQRPMRHVREGGTTVMPAVRRPAVPPAPPAGRHRR